MSYSPQIVANYRDVRGHLHSVSYFPKIDDFMGFCARIDRDSFFTTYTSVVQFFAETAALMGTLGVVASVLPADGSEWVITHEGDTMGSDG